ncbi:thioesterase domain-containing protein [Longispora sp. NPDC051575]|uniref:thioesterase domain-containing protein n=1 Tax=Longispora sp. NPDC051575 TaxID=3154943 RepID=UPI00343D8E2F
MTAILQSLDAVEADPRNTIEGLVSTQWTNVLQCAPRDHDEDFFVAGGSLLSAAAFASRLAEIFGGEVSVQLIYDNPSVRGLCASIRSGGAGVRPRILPLTLEGDGPPLLVVPGAFGNPAVMNGFTDPIFGRRVFGLEHRGMRAGSGEPLRDVAQVSRDYADEIVKWRPAEPVHLAGYCTGAVYALEVTRELVGRGWAVRSVTMLSPTTQPAETWRPSFEWLYEDRFRRIAASAGLEHYSGELTAAALFAELRARDAAISRQYVEDVIARARLFVSNYYAMTNYVPSQFPADPPIAMLFGDGEEGDLAASYWPAAVGERVGTCRRFAVDHLDMPGHPDVLAALAAVMREADQGVGEAHPSTVG